MERIRKNAARTVVWRGKDDGVISTHKGNGKSDGDERKENQHQRRESREDVRDGLLLISQAFI